MTEERVEAAEAVGRVWADLGIPHLVMHGLESYPVGLGRDLDILMRREVADRAVLRAAEVLAGFGWRIVCPPALWGRRLIALRGDSSENLRYIELHTMPSLRWAALPLVDGSEPAIGNIGPFSVSPWATFAKTVLTPLLAGDLDRFKPGYLDNMDKSGVNSDIIVSRASRFFGATLARRFAAAVESRDAAELKRLSGAARRAAMRYMFRHPVGSATALPEFTRQKVGRMFSSSGLKARLSISARDEAEDVASALVYRLRRVFVIIEVDARDSVTRRLGHQYRVLSRQGLVLQVGTSGEDEWRLEIVAESPTGLVTRTEEEISISPITTDSPVDEVARILVERWEKRHYCATATGFRPGATCAGKESSGQ